MYKRTSSLLLSFILFFILFTSCSQKKNDRIVIWTNSGEFAPYVELFNSQHKTKAVLVYKKAPAVSLPPANDELKPDIVIGSYLRNNKTKKYFEPVDYLFDRKYISYNDFYPVLVKAGVFSHKQYLLPLSFNLPVVIFSTENSKYVTNNYTISLEELRKEGSSYNKKNKKNNFTAIGFAPQSSKDFLYSTTKMFNTNYKETKNQNFIYDSKSLQDSLNYLKDWITTENVSSQTESDFVYKYLSMVDSKKVTSDRTLFAYTTSDKLFQLSGEQLSQIDFRWMENNNLIHIEDSMTMLGISKWANNHSGCAEFISWLFNPETQRQLLENKKSMHPDTVKFGIASGFSSIKEVNEHILPTIYTKLLSNIPPSDYFKVSEPTPIHWEAIKSRVIIPYIQDYIRTEDTTKIKSIEERFSNAKKQGLN